MTIRAAISIGRLNKTLPPFPELSLGRKSKVITSHFVGYLRPCKGATQIPSFCIFFLIALRGSLVLARSTSQVHTVQIPQVHALASVMQWELSHARDSFGICVNVAKNGAMCSLGWASHKPGKAAAESLYGCSLWGVRGRQRVPG